MYIWSRDGDKLVGIPAEVSISCVPGEEDGQFLFKATAETQRPADHFVEFDVKNLVKLEFGKGQQ